MKKLLAVAAVVASALLVVSAEAKTCVWTGAGANGKWTNPDNWKDGEIPGRIDVSGGGIDGNKGDVAQFGSVADGAKTTIDLADMRSVMRLEIVSGAPVYTFGTSSSQPLRLEAHATEGETNGIFVAAGVENMPVFAGKMVFFQDYMATAPGTTIENNGSGILDLKEMSAPVKDPEATVSNYGNRYHFYFKGTGDIRVNGQDVDNFGAFHFQQSGKFIVNCMLLGRSYSHYAPFGIIADGELTTPAEVVINEGCCLVPRLQYDNYISAETRDLKVSGDGWFGSQYPGNYTRIKVKTGYTLEVDSIYKAINNSSEAQISSLHLDGVSGYLGTLRLNGDANVMTNVEFYSGGVLEVMKIGGRGEPGSLGDDSTIYFGGGSTIRYLGSGETTGKRMFLKVPTGAEWAALCHAGTGPWEVASPITVIGKSQTLTLTGEREDATLSSDLEDRSASIKLSLAKTGTGTWTIAGACRHTGQTKVSSGVLKLASAGSLAASPVLLDGGELVVEGDGETGANEIASIAATKSGTIRLRGKATLEIGAYVSGTIDVIPESDDAQVVFTDASLRGTTPTWLRWKGAAAKVGEDGAVTVNADATIAAKGDEVPTGLGRVFVTKAGTGDDTVLAADETTVSDTFGQIADVPATIRIGAGQSLEVGNIEIVKGAQDLALGSVAGQGVLKSVGKLTFLSADSNRTLTVRADLQPGTEAVVNGVGTTAFAGGMSARKPITVKTSTLKLTGGQVFKAGDIKISPGGANTEAKLVIDGANIVQGREPVYVGYENVAGLSRMIITNSTWVNERTLNPSFTGADVTNNHICVGWNGNAILEIQSGSVVSNFIGVGGSWEKYQGYGDATLRISGGTTMLGVGDYRGTYMGNVRFNSHCLIEGGELFARDIMPVGTYSYGTMTQTGGRFVARNSANTTDGGSLKIQTANGAHGQFRMTGGVAKMSYLDLVSTYNSTAHAWLVLDGDAELSAGRVRSCLNYANAKSISHVVLNGGVLRAEYFLKLKESVATVAFGGGTLAPSANNCTLFNGADTLTYDRITVGAGGATIDTDGKTGTKITLPLTAPTGKGVVGLTGFTPLTGRAVEPAVWVTGDGTGAVAHAEWDCDTLTVTNIVIDSPGCDYNTAEIKLYFQGGNSSACKTYTAVLADNVTTGSFTKAGAGDLTLSAANTWGGATVAAGGTLKAGCDWAIPADSPVVLAGGKIDFGGKVGSVSKITYKVGGGSIANAENVTLPSTFDLAITAEEVLAKQSIPLTGDQDLTGKTLTITGDFSSLDPEVSRKYTVVSVSGGTISGEPTIVAPALPKDWSFVTRPNGVKLVNPLGMMLLVR